MIVVLNLAPEKQIQIDPLTGYTRIFSPSRAIWKAGQYFIHKVPNKIP
jgi:hypothetical protein